MAFEFDVVAARLLRDSEIGVARNPGLNFDEIDTMVAKHIYCLATACWCSDGNGCLVGRCRTVEHGPGDHHSGAKYPVGGDRLPCLKYRAERTAHVAHTGDAECDEEGKDEILAIRCGAVKEDMSVHVPEAGDQKTAVGIDDLAGGRRWAMNEHGNNAVSFDDHRI